MGGCEWEIRGREAQLIASGGCLRRAVTVGMMLSALRVRKLRCDGSAAVSVVKYSCLVVVGEIRSIRKLSEFPCLRQKAHLSESLGEESPQVNTHELPINKPKFRLCKRRVIYLFIHQLCLLIFLYN